MDARPRTVLEVELHGSDLTSAAVEDVAQEIAERLTGALAEVARVIGHPLPDGLKVAVARVDVKCDGCGHRQPLHASRAGWHLHICPTCLVGDWS